MDLRRIVTGFTETGSSTIITDEPALATSVAALPGVTFYRMWGTEDGASEQNSDAQPMPYWPGASGTRCVVIRFSPQSSSAEAPAVNAEVVADMERLLPGLAGAFEPDGLGFHTTRSIDYGVCLEGELFLILDDDEEVRIVPGMCVVQRGTRHAWEHRSDRDAVMLFVLIGTDDVQRL